MKRYRSYRFDRPSARRPARPWLRPGPARQQLDDERVTGQLLFTARVALSLGFLFTVRIAAADAVDGSLWTAMGWAGAAAACLALAVFVRLPR